ncbi:MAG: hypothetical protein ACXVXW_15430 [Mycobacteriaceae bacterium]
MTDGRLRRVALRMGAALILGVVLVLAGWAFRSPSASAAPTATVYVRDLTPPVASVDAGGSVTFINQIADKTLSVGVGPLAVTAVVHTDVTVNVPSGAHIIQPSPQALKDPQPTPQQLKPEQSWTEKFAQTCATCTISYAYRVDGAQLGQVLSQLPALPAAPVPFVVNTLLPLPNLPGVNLPQLPQINVSLPSLPGQLPSLPGQKVPSLPGQSGTTTLTTTTTTTTVQGLGGPLASYGLNGVDMAPNGRVAVRAFDPSQAGSTGNGSGGTAAGKQIGAPQLANDSSASPFSSRYPLPALLALVSVAAVATALARTLLSRVGAER